MSEDILRPNAPSLPQTSISVIASAINDYNARMSARERELERGRFKTLANSTFREEVEHAVRYQGLDNYLERLEESHYKDRHTNRKRELAALANERQAILRKAPAEAVEEIFPQLAGVLRTYEEAIRRMDFRVSEPPLITQQSNQSFFITEGPIMVGGPQQGQRVTNYSAHTTISVADGGPIDTITAPGIVMLEEGDVIRVGIALGVELYRVAHLPDPLERRVRHNLPPDVSGYSAYARDYRQWVERLPHENEVARSITPMRDGKAVRVYDFPDE